MENLIVNIFNVLTGLFICYIGLIHLHFIQGKSDLGMKRLDADKMRSSETRMLLNKISVIIIFAFGTLFAIAPVLRLFGIIKYYN